MVLKSTSLLQIVQGHGDGGDGASKRRRKGNQGDRSGEDSDADRGAQLGNEAVSMPSWEPCRTCYASVNLIMW